MNWSDIGNTISKYAPLAGAALTSPVGAVIGVGTVISNLFGVKADPESVMDYIQQNPEKAQERLQYEMANNIELQNISLNVLKENNRNTEQIISIDAQDRDSARKRQETIKDNVPAILAVLFTLGFFCVLFLNEFIKLTDNGINNLTAAEMLVLAYYFGASNKK